jgi:hypothetical protein
MGETVVTKKLVLVKPLYTTIPAGVYEVVVYDSWQNIYWINEFAHNANRFVEPSSLILELF